MVQEFIVPISSYGPIKPVHSANLLLQVSGFSEVTNAHEDFGGADGGYQQ
jgi:hypothetical protein